MGTQLHAAKAASALCQPNMQESWVKESGPECVGFPISATCHCVPPQPGIWLLSASNRWLTSIAHSAQNSLSIDVSWVLCRTAVMPHPAPASQRTPRCCTGSTPSPASRPKCVLLQVGSPSSAKKHISKSMCKITDLGSMRGEESRVSQPGPSLGQKMECWFCKHLLWERHHRAARSLAQGETK